MSGVEEGGSEFLREDDIMNGTLGHAAPSDALTTF